MQGIKRRVIYVSLYEFIAIVLVSAALIVLGHDPLASGSLSVAASTIAVAWNWIWNSLFERWESRQVTRGRSVKRRIAHAIGFEGGLAILLVPVFAWWLKVSLWEAVVLDASLLLFFLVYTFVYNWGFDKIFGLPRSAMPAP